MHYMHYVEHPSPRMSRCNVLFECPLKTNELIDGCLSNKHTSTGRQIRFSTCSWHWWWRVDSGLCLSIRLKTKEKIYEKWWTEALTGFKQPFLLSWIISWLTSIFLLTNLNVEHDCKISNVPLDIHHVPQVWNRCFEKIPPSI